MGTYDDPEALRASLAQIKELLAREGCESFYVKRLSPNDNSKNQPYFGKDLNELSFIPSGDVQASLSTSAKRSKTAVKFQASVELSWLSPDGHSYPAPHAKLIFYPQYPEVRFSGFLRGSKVAMSEWMNPDKSGRDPDRWLILAPTAAGSQVFGYFVPPLARMAKELARMDYGTENISSVFHKFSLLVGSTDQQLLRDNKRLLLEQLQGISEKGWLKGIRLTAEGKVISYDAPNAGGYTLEALLGVVPNSRAEPDYLGWEIKQYGVTAFPNKGARVSTLMTPDPDGGVYADGIFAFVQRYGYPDTRGRPDRYNFGGVHRATKACLKTNLSLIVDGFDTKKASITNAHGAIRLLDRDGGCAAQWSFAKLMTIWKRKHARTAFVPCKTKRNDADEREYRFGPAVTLCQGARFDLFLKGVCSGAVYYDPAIKITDFSTSQPKPKIRNQFRCAHKNLLELYSEHEFISFDQ